MFKPPSGPIPKFIHQAVDLPGIVAVFLQVLRSNLHKDPGRGVLGKEFPEPPQNKKLRALHVNLDQMKPCFSKQGAQERGSMKRHHFFLPQTIG